MTTQDGSLRAIAAVLRTVPDLAAAEKFYRDALGFEVTQPSHPLGPDETALLGTPGSHVSRLVMRLGRQTIEFLRFDPGGRPYRPGSTASDLWFQHCAIVAADMDTAYRQLSRHSFTALSVGGPQQLPPDNGGVRAFKFRDPFGHPLELLWFPAGTGDPAWQGSPQHLFKGIDHTAIAVGDAEASSRFYQEALGLKVADRTRNRGLAQDRLDAIWRDDVDVVALAPPVGPPHLELLGYRAGTRRPQLDVEADDGSLSRTLAVIDDEARIVAALAQRGPDELPVRRGRWNGRTALAFSDLDGHRWICVTSA